MPMIRPLSLTLVLCSLCLTSAPVLAQNASAAGKASNGPGKTITGQAAAGKLMTFKELESCLKEYDGLQPQAASLNQRREALEAQRKPIDAEGAAIRDDPRRAALATKLNDFNARQQAVNARGEAYKARSEALKNGQFTGNASEERAAMERERLALNDSATALMAEAPQLTAEREALVAELKQRAEAQSAKVDAWNAANKALDGETQAFDGLRQAWSDRCGNRPYNEEHEKIIRSGK